MSILRKWLILEPGLLLVFLFSAYSNQDVEEWKRLGVLFAIRTLSLTLLILFSEMISFAELLRGLRYLKVPQLLLNTLSLMYRYGFVLSEESFRMKKARQSRTFTSGRVWEWRVQATVASQLLIRAFDRAERIYAAMCSRGWDVTGN